MPKRIAALIFLAVCLTLNSPVLATVWKVPLEFPTIQEAIDWAQPGDTVILSKGTYTGAGNKDLDFGGKAITVQSLDPEDPCVVAATVIDCENNGRGFNFYSGETYSSVVSGLTIKNGNAGIGGAIRCYQADPTISRCKMSSNSVSDWGGGIYCFESGALIDRCIINSNYSGYKGGGISCGLRGHPTISNCLIFGNVSGSYGGGIECNVDNPTIINCTISGNHSIRRGGGIHSYSSSPPIITNSIIWGNTATEAYPNIWVEEGRDERYLVVSYSDVEGGYAGTGNINLDPCFVDSDGGDYHISLESPCVNTGEPGYSLLPEETDIDGEPRVMGIRVDMGGDEFFINRPIFEILPSEFEFSAKENGTNPESKSLSIRNLGEGILNWEIYEDCTWLSAGPNSGSCSTGEVNDVSINVDITGLGAGSYNCELVISDPNAVNNPQTVNVNLIVQGPMIGLSVAKLQFRALEYGANPDDQTLSISNVGGGTLNWTVSHDCNWLSVEPYSGSSTGIVNDVTISVDISSFSSGIYNCDLTISAPNALNNPQTVAVELIVIDSPVLLNHDAEAYAYSHVDGIGGSDTDTAEDFSNNSKARAQARANAGYCDMYPIFCELCLFSSSNMDVGGEVVYGSDMVSLTSRFRGSGGWSVNDSCGGDEDGLGGGDGNGYTSMAGMLTIGNFKCYPAGSSNVILKIDAEILGDGPSRWGNWDWWLKIWDDDPNYPLALLSDGNISEYLDVLEGQVLNFEFYHNAHRLDWPEAGLESTLEIDLRILPPPDWDNDFDVDFYDYAWFVMVWSYRPSNLIPRGSVVVDGDLSDWPPSVEWIELDEVYLGNPNDVSEARFALQWDEATGKVYAAVVVNDTNHLFLDEYVYWDASDRIEVYSQGDAENGAGWNGIYDVAQQYYVAPDTSDGNWATWAEGDMLGGDEGFEYAVDVNGAQIIYEVGVRQFDNYGGFSGTETLLTDLHPGHVVGFDIVACTRWDTTNFGMLSENLMMGKYKDAGKFAKYILVDEIFSTDLDGNGANNNADLGILFESWLDYFMTKATHPKPADDATCVDPNVTLRWVSEDVVLYHDVYLGTDAGAVANAGHLSPEFMGTVSDPNFDPCGLEWATTYYWRIDEAGPSCMTQGVVWRFKTYDDDCSPKAWWRFDGGSGTTAYDSAGNNHGTIYGATWTTGKINGALDFDGNDYVEVSDDPSLRFTQYDSFSICSWAKPVGGSIVCKMRASAQWGYFGYNIGYTSGNKYRFTADRSRFESVSVYTGEIPQGDWSHVTAVYDNMDMKIYLDGELEGMGTFVGKTDVRAPDKNLAIGARSFDSVIDQHFTGIIDDVRIYDRVLSAEEIEKLYQNGLN
ncbi:MAG: hypothetical protein FVQ85_17920 [Planctomycetes bacterium]|nr:hypothetical protein [Planctomycetota bacterium]